MAHIQIDDIDPSITYTVGAARSSFPVPFAYFENSNLVVTVDGDVLTLNTDYAVTGTAVDAGFSSGTVVLDTAVTDVIVTIERILPIERTTDFPDSGPLSTPTINTQFDKIIAICQQLQAGIEAVGQRLTDYIALFASLFADGSTQNLYETRGALALANVALGINYIRTAGYHTAGDGGGALYVRAGGGSLGGLQSADGAWWELSDEELNIRQFGAKGDGSTNDSAAIQDAIDAVNGAGGGFLIAPAGNYSVTDGIEIKSGVRVIGEGRDITIFQAWHTDVTVVTMSGNATALEEVAVYGKGQNSDPGTFGAVNNALVVTCSNGVLFNVRAWGGSGALFITGVDCYLEYVEAGNCYGTAVVITNGANWYHRCKFDHGASGVAQTDSQPYAAWSAAQAVTVGQVRIVAGYALICSVAGTTGGVAPALKNYGLPMTDGTATWMLEAPQSFTGMLFGQSCGENHIFQTDFSGSGYTASVSIDVAAPLINGPSMIVLDSCVMSSGIAIEEANWVKVLACELAGDVVINSGFTGAVHISGNVGLGVRTLRVGVDVSNFIIVNNYLSSGFITIDAGASDHYVVMGNVGVTVSDGGTGIHKSVTGNVA